MPKKPEARAQALKMYVESKGKATHKAIAEAVGVTSWTIGQWSRAENWKKKLEEVKAPPVVKRRKAAAVKTAPAVTETKKVEANEAAPALRKRKSRAGTLLKRNVFDRAAKIFLESGGKISNVELGRRVGVTGTTIATWKKMPQWSESVVVASTEPSETAPAVQEAHAIQKAPAAEVAPAQAASVPEIQESAPASPFVPETITALQDLVALNERLRGMLIRDFLTAEEIEHLSNAKLALLEAAEVYLGIVTGSGE